MSLQDWHIKPRSKTCAVTGKAFEEEEIVHSLLFIKGSEFDRMDVCVEAWEKDKENWKAVSSWASKYRVPPPPPPETLKKDDVEGLLRLLIQENQPEHSNARYVLAVMLERKRILKQIDRQQQDGRAVLLYEHVPTGETWIVQDPGLKLDELGPVQAEVAQLLGARMIV